MQVSETSMTDFWYSITLPNSRAFGTGATPAAVSLISKIGTVPVFWHIPLFCLRKFSTRSSYVQSSKQSGQVVNLPCVSLYPCRFLRTHNPWSEITCRTLLVFMVSEHAWSKDCSTSNLLAGKSFVSWSLYYFRSRSAVCFSFFLPMK